MQISLWRSYNPVSATLYLSQSAPSRLIARLWCINRQSRKGKGFHYFVDVLFRSDKTDKEDITASSSNFINGPLNLHSLSPICSIYDRHLLKTRVLNMQRLLHTKRRPQGENASWYAINWDLLWDRLNRNNAYSLYCCLIN